MGKQDKRIGKWHKGSARGVIAMMTAGALLLGLFSSFPSLARNLEPEDNSSYHFPEEDTSDDNNDEEDLTGKILIAVRKPADFQVYSKKEGVFIVRAKNKGEVDGYDIRVTKVATNAVVNFRAITRQNLFRRFIGGKPDAKYKVRVRAFRDINGKIYPSKWTKEKQVIVWPRSDIDDPPSNTTLNSLGREDLEMKSDSSGKKRKNK